MNLPALVALLLVGAPAAGASPDAGFDVLHYDVELRVEGPGGDRAPIIEGRERIDLRNGPHPRAVFIFPRNQITVTAAHGPARTPLAVWSTADTIEIALPTPVPPGRRTSLHLSYRASSPRALRLRGDHLHTGFFTCHWMICREESGDKATHALAITTTPGAGVIATGKPIATVPAAGATVHRFRDDVATSSYLYGFAIGHFVRHATRHRGVALSGHGAGVDEATLARMLADTPTALDFFSARAGVPLPRRHYDQIVVAGEEAQEASSFSLLGRSYLEADLAAPADAWVLAHELAHQFWGNLVTCADWSDFWLNEGITTFMVAAWKEHRFGRAAYDQAIAAARARKDAAAAAGWDVPLAYRGRHPSLRLSRAIAYSKGAVFLAELRARMGDGAFWAALRRFTRRHAGGTATSADFARAFTAVSPVDLGPLFAAWVFPPP